MFDESLLDRPDDLARADTTGLLRGAASAGARVRTAARLAAEAGVGDLKPDGRPRTVLVAGPGDTPRRLADLLGALAACPVLPLPATGDAPTARERRWTLPGWAGPLDLLLIATADGTEPGFALLVEQAYRRGCTISAVTPAAGPLGAALQQARGFLLPFATAPHGEPGTDPGTFWAQLTPLLALSDRIGLLSAPPGTLAAVADRLDTAATRFGPAADTYGNPAKTLTTELADHLPLLWSSGPGTEAVARRFADLLTARAGRPALAAALPEALTVHGALLVTHGRTAPADDDLDDFFRDRVEEPDTLRPRAVLFREPGDTAGPRALIAAHAAADDRGTPVTQLDAPPGDRLEALAELLALTEFAAAYLALTPTGDTTA
ncbi:SIS domain-containing protein [Streptomyces sp. SL13]|uniref:SIS domain-containing protein n=1 Tax=Streptantibioticus silvisoli TaxID=2705255 RepID=A0AA90KIU0_9ACTN|nr:SIS domain-containing protein [Streptantibioticus silvisoli]MDI5973019.1 SIS domain-containing protein [Streptantibioticus silvisoli]